MRRLECMRVCAVLVSLFAGACGFGDNSLSHLAGGGGGDDDGSSGHGSDDAGTDSGGGGTTKDGGPHLLISEVKSVGTGEFIEIVNPTTKRVDLSNYYLSDSNAYWKLPGHVSGSQTITLLTSDFLVRFPVGNIESGQVITIALDELEFVAEYSLAPDLAITSEGLGTPAMIEVIATSGPTITDDGEMIVLFHWDGHSALVDDVDLAIAGDASTVDNLPIAKAAVDGPDGDGVASAYAVDALSFIVVGASTSATHSYKRLALEGAFEDNTKRGNGITGHDETSEDLRSTWDFAPYTVPTPGVVPAALLP